MRLRLYIADHFLAGILSGFALCMLPMLSFSQRVPFHNLSVDDGLIQSQAKCLAQDRTGNLWIGTLGGLSRYDGKTFTNYTVRNGLLNNIVNAIAVDAQNNIWISGPSGVSQFNGRSFSHYTVQQQTVRTVFTAQQLTVVHDTVWWRNKGEVYYISGGKIKYFKTPGKAASASAILVDKSDLWVAKDDTLYHCHNNKWDTITFSASTTDRNPGILNIYKEHNGTLWAGTNRGLYKVVGGHLMEHHIGDAENGFYPAIFCITQDPSGALWLGIGNGALKLSATGVQIYNKRNGLSDNFVNDMLTDAEGNIWMATDGQGIYRHSGTRFTVLDETMGLPSAQVMSIATNRRDSLFLGTLDAGLFVFKDGKVSPLSFPEGPAPSVYSLCYAHDSRLWIGTRNLGLWCYAGNTFRQFTAPDRGFPSNNITSLYEDREHRLWIGFINGAMLYQHDSFKVLPIKDTTVLSFLTIGNDSTLIVTENSLLLCVDGFVSPFRTNPQVDSSAIKCIARQGQYLWLGSSDNGVIRYDMSSRKSVMINKSNGLRSDFIYNIVIDNDGDVWVGTGFGIHRIHMNDKDEPHVSFYGRQQGITGMESNINSVLKLPDGGIWFGTTNGAIHYLPHSTVITSAPRSIILQSVKLTGESTIEKKWYDSTDNWYGIPYHLRLPYQKNNISFTFQAVTLNGTQQVLYRYHLDGLETPWSDWSVNNAVAYSALPPGKYIFRIQCKSAEGASAPELTYPFEIITPYHKTKWFRYSILIACLLTGILLQYLFNNRKQRRLELLEKLRREEQAKIRLRTAEDFHDEIGNKLTRINVLTNVLKTKIPPTPDTLRILGQIEENTSQLYGGTRDILWSLKPANDNLYEILHRIRDFGNDLFQDTDVRFSFSGTEEKWRNFRLPMDMSRNLIMIFKEALNNTLKYAKATEVSLEVNIKNRNQLSIVLKDNGSGFDIQTIKKGNGLNNMQVRAARLNGKLYVDSRTGKGTIITLNFKIPQNK